MIYADNAATTKVDNNVLNEMLPYLINYYGNPSTLYSIGAKTNDAVCDAKNKIAKVLNCEASEVYFTSCGSEGDTWILRSVADTYYGQKIHMIVSCIEHHAILNTCEILEKQGVEITYIPVGLDGVISVDYIKDAIKDNTVLVSVMAVNNETGVIQPIREIADICENFGILMHTDAVQAAGHISLNVEELGVDYLTISGHKFYAPKGIGVCYVKKHAPIRPLICGGKQEYGVRGGTENVANIVAIGSAIEMAYSNLEENNKHLRKLSERLITGLNKNIPNLKINGKNRISSTVNVSFPDVDGEIMQMELDAVGICVSTGSACNSGLKEPSYVLTSMGIDRETALSSVRFSFGKFNTEEEVEAIINEVTKIYNRIVRERERHGIFT